MRRSLSVGAIALIGTLALSSCSSPDAADSDEPVTLNFTWWGNDARAGWMEQAIDLFEADNPDVTINGSFSDYPSYIEKRSIEAAAGNLPDVMLFDVQFLRDYADRGLLLDLGTVGDALDLSGVEDKVLATGSLNDTQYAVPTGTNIPAVMYNSTVYETAGVAEPVTDDGWDAFYASQAKIAAAGDDTWGLDHYSVSSLYTLEVQLLQEGHTMFDEEGKLGFDEKRLTQFWTDYLTVADSGAIVPSQKETEIAPQFALATGLVGSRLAADSTAPTFISEIAPILSFKAPPSDTGKSGIYARPALMLTSGANTDHPKAAAEFISFMINDPRVTEFFGASLGAPVTQAQRDAVERTDLNAAILDYQASVADVLESPSPAAPAGWAALSAHFYRIAGEVGLGTTSIQDGVAEFFSEAKLAKVVE